VGLSGLDGGILKAQKRPPVAVDGQVVDFGLVGDIASVDVSLVRHLIEGGYVPVIAPFSVDENGQVLNTNADTVATELAIALKAEKLFFMLKLPGLLSDPSNPSSLVPYADLGRLAEMEAAGAIKDGMRPKIAATRKALALGVHSVHFVSGVLPDALLTEVFTNEGSGTMITTASEP
jgi:acetylglutamate kinase